ncbi:MAG: hypothetical protein QNK23_01430 [Crocinitomicaceae bacterium]|nr:hypothetical protein [Crocinitomicaceae bacterium]
MKKIIFPLAAGLLLFASCAKDYTCTCTSTTTQTPLGASSTITTSTTTTDVTDVKETFVSEKMECYSNEYSYSYDDWVGDPVQVTVENDCTITK